jgi:hypothetical protein
MQIDIWMMAFMAQLMYTLIPLVLWLFAFKYYELAVKLERALKSQ